ncbi:Hypothetical predicted protein [Paramuricea clavata]|uniref:Uncharacterized protein n=1 Tax=Paramuricea clavata TaxID=317549 RepID=A0A7D9JTI1_PARCT|nr:Hypothetical predicted protein [Paramuricea clavata]
MATSFKRSAKTLNNSVHSTPKKPAQKQAKMQESREVNLEEIWTVISSVNEKLSKLDKLDTIETRLNNIDDEINTLKHSLSYQHDTAAEIQESQKEQDKKITKLEEKITEIELEKVRMNSEIVDIKARSMRNNLMLFSLPEETNETPEKSMEKVYEIVENKHGIHDARRTMPIERAHRMGRNRFCPVHLDVDQGRLWQNSCASRTKS